MAATTTQAPCGNPTHVLCDCGCDGEVRTDRTTPITVMEDRVDQDTGEVTSHRVTYQLPSHVIDVPHDTPYLSFDGWVAKAKAGDAEAQVRLSGWPNKQVEAALKGSSLVVTKARDGRPQVSEPVMVEGARADGWHGTEPQD